MTEKYSKICFKNYLELSGRLKRAEERADKAEAKLDEIRRVVA